MGTRSQNQEEQICFISSVSCCFLQHSNSQRTQLSSSTESNLLQHGPKIWNLEAKKVSLYTNIKEIAFWKGRKKPNYLQNQTLGMLKHLGPNLNYKVSYRSEPMEKLSFETEWDLLPGRYVPQVRSPKLYQVDTWSCYLHQESRVNIRPSLLLTCAREP